MESLRKSFRHLTKLGNGRSRNILAHHNRLKLRKQLMNGSFIKLDNHKSSAVYDIKSCIITAEDAKVAKKFL